MGLHARYVVLEDDFANLDPLVIKDVGPWDKHLSVTNDAEFVVKELHGNGNLPAGRQLFYIDSEGAKDELLHDGAGKFTGFKAGPR